MVKKLALMVLLFGSFGLQATRRKAYEAVMHVHCARCNRCLEHKSVVIKVSSRNKLIRLKCKKHAHNIIRRFRVLDRDRFIIQRLNAPNSAMWRKITVHRSLVHLVDPCQWVYQGESCRGVTFVSSKNCTGRSVFSYPRNRFERALRAARLQRDGECRHINRVHYCV